MRFFRHLCIVLVLFLVGRGFAAETGGRPAPVLLISMDGFRWDYTALHPAETPHIRQLAAEGVTSRGLIPVFPSNTFPNHYSIVTGLYPSHSGILNNHMWDADLHEAFVYTQRKSARDSRWWGGEPIWITAVRQGRASACSFWPGSEAEIKGTHATFWKPYDYSVPFEQRLDELVGWLKLPEAQRPAVITFYLEEANSAGHKYGPDSAELVTTLKMLDGRIAAITSRLATENLPVNYVLVSDHGMTNCGPDRVLVLDDYLDLKTVQVDFEETSCGLRPLGNTTADAVVQALAKMPHAKAYRAADLPARLHVDPNSPRVPPVWILPDEGWQVLTRGVFNAVKEHFVHGQHGYDPALPAMHGIFIASGPAFRRGVVIPEVENVHIYNLLCAAAGLKPAPNDGDDRLVRAALRAGQ
jgi:predicted AlkP superfamily pyrophosphatase or phosphodiesterase